MKNLFFILSMLFLVYSCKEDPVTPAKSQQQWIYSVKKVAIDEYTSVYKIIRINIDNGEIQLIADSARIFCQPQNGKIIYQKYSDRISADSGEVRDYFIYMANLDGSNPVQIREWNTSGSITFAPGGKTAAFKKYRDLYLLDLMNGGFNEEMKSLDDDIYDFSFSPDGSKLAFIKSEKQMYIYNINKSYYNLIYDGADTANLAFYTICWNYKHNELIFGISVDSVYYLVAYDLQKRSLRVILKGKYVLFPCVFPDGEKILWYETIHNPGEPEVVKIWQCNIDGSGLEEIKANNGENYALADQNTFINDTEILVGRYYDGYKKLEMAVLNIVTGDIRIISENIWADD